MFYDIIFSDDKDLRNDDAHLKAVYDFVIQKINDNEEKYKETIEKRRQAGKASGEARKSKSEQNEHVLTSVESVEQVETKRTDNDNVNDNDITSAKISEFDLNRASSFQKK